MKYYLIDVWSYIPYPIKKSYRIERSGYAPAVSEAIKKYRKEVGRKKITELYTKAIQITLPKGTTHED